MKLPSMPRKGIPLETTAREIINFLRASRITNVTGGLLKESPNGTTIEIKAGGGGKKTTNEAAPNCPFGEIFVDGEDTKLRGGPLYCGDKNFNVGDQTLNLAVDGDWLVQIELSGIEPNKDDDGEILLPGVKTTSGTPAWDNKTNTPGTTNYDDNTNPTITTDGTIFIPIGRLVILDDVATFTPTDCGSISVTQCAGILSHSRG